MKKLLLFTCLMVSCTVGENMENDVMGNSESLAEISFAAEIAGEQEVEVISVLSEGVESKISDITLASYGADGRLADVRYFESGFASMLLSVRSDGLSNIYALVNMGDMSELFPMYEEEVKNMEYYVQSYYAVDNKGFPMSGVLRGFSSESLHGVITVQRLFAKLCVRITHRGLSGYSQSDYYAYNMCNKSLYVRQANRRLLPFSDQGSKALKSADILGLSDSHQNLNDRNAYQGSLSQSGLGPGPGYAQDTTVVFYVPENVQGNLLPHNDDPFGKVYDEISDVGGKSYSDLCTYLEFNARRENTQGYSGEVMFRYYLGEDNTSDFSLVRNKRYDITLDFTEDGFFADTWKVTRGEDWSDVRILKFLGAPFSIHPGENVDLLVHYHRAGLVNIDSQNQPDDWELKVDKSLLASAGLDYSFDPSRLVAGNNGYKDFCITVSASKDAVVGRVVPMEVVTRDGKVSDRAFITVAAPSGLSPSWTRYPEYVAQEGVVSFPNVPDSDLPLSVSLSDESKVSCMRLSDRSFRVIALKPGAVTVRFTDAYGTESTVTQLDIKAPILDLDDSELLLNPDGDSRAFTYRYRDIYGKILSGFNASAFDSLLLPIVETESCFRSEVNSSSVSMEIASLKIGASGLGLGGTYDAMVRAAGCDSVVPKKLKLKVADPFEGMVERDYGVIDDYTLFAQSNVNSILRTRFQAAIDANGSFEYPVFVPLSESGYVSVSLEPVWGSDFSNRNGVFKAELNSSARTVRISYNSLSSVAEHSAGRHKLMLYVTNRHSLEKVGRSCGTLDVYVHTAVGARAVFGSQKCGYNPFGNETFASVYNKIAERAVYSYPSSSSIIHYMDVSMEWMTDVSKVYVWNRMNTAAQAGSSWMDALDIVRPSVSDGQLNSNTRMLYSVMNGSDSRISVAGEKYGQRKGIGRVIYRALLQATYNGVLSDYDLKMHFFGYQSHTGNGTVAMAPCYTLHDLNRGSDFQNNKVISRMPYYFSPSSCATYVDDQGRGYHVIHFLEEISPGTYGWINLL